MKRLGQTLTILLCPIIIQLFGHLKPGTSWMTAELRTKPNTFDRISL